MTATMPNIEFVRFSKLYNWSVQYLLEDTFSYNQAFPLVTIGTFLKRNKTSLEVKNGIKYKRVTIKTNNGGVFLRDIEVGEKIGTKNQFVIKEGQFLVSKIDARNGAFGVVTNEVDGAIITGNFWAFDVDYSVINPHYLALITTTPEFIKFCENSSTGTTNRHYLQEDLFLAVEIPLPPLDEEDAIKRNLPNTVTQETLVDAYNQKISEAETAKTKAQLKEAEIEKYMLSKLGISNSEEDSLKGGLKFVKFKDLNEWGVTKLDSNSILFSTIYPNQPLSQIAEINPTTSFNKLPASMKVAFLPMANISDIEGEVIFYSEGKVANAKGYTKFKDGDLLWARITPCMENGKSAIVKNMENGYGYGSTEYHIIRTEDETLSKYIHLLLRYEKILQAAKTHFTGSAGQQRVPKSFLENLEVPVPDRIVQEEIVGRVSELKSEIKEMYNQAILSKKQALIDFENQIFKRN
ncbi:MAG: restriction endonuclease subunit S [Cytophagaceae bacterium]|nr:restriction endonuclease subunit S [Cytophagaceae bacterium]